MPRHTEERSAHIEVIPAALEQKPVLANLLELYCHDFSEFHDIEIGASGRFVYPHLSQYWSEPGCHPFLTKVDGKLAGFVLVKNTAKTSGDVATWDLAEFFVLRGYRRRGVGTAIAREVWRRLPGRWQVRVMESNPAQHFWERTIAEFTSEASNSVRIEKGGAWWRVFSFESGG